MISHNIHLRGYEAHLRVLPPEEERPKLMETGISGVLTRVIFEELMEMFIFPNSRTVNATLPTSCLSNVAWGAIATRSAGLLRVGWAEVPCQW